MKTIILPGFSLSNREWAYELKKELDLDHEVIVHEWKHWETSTKSASLKFEIESLLKKAEKKKLNIIAKSFGTRVTMHLALKIPEKIGKVILCGIPTKFTNESTKKLYSDGLKKVNAENVICFQNTKDPFANYRIIKKFVGSINPKIKVVEKPRSDHHYPYPEDFQKFLKD